MKNSLLLSTVLTALLFTACKKDDIAKKPQKEEYIQFFDAQIGGQQVAIRNSIDKNRSVFQGQWTGVGNGKGETVDMYTVNVQLPNDKATDLIETRLRFQIFDIEPKAYQISGQVKYYETFGTYIGLSKKLDNGSWSLYVPQVNKKPFEVGITKYQFVYGSGVPIVGGTLNGTLYNEKNLQDSIVIKNGKFEVRY
ncbi:DUF5025 domain-containing protein [Pedobacter sp. KR3-3]|uniref:DUF5025 domain-containing protein n=1 Tax=Pedobacter albus TaxID=3113905 RepID=A0ABU7ICM1_9SPHI|nr:DUF5025 domain-containing protein [Pedobacter sp. KR3-3]MEE1947089.1 DUF5025 domain-containing protein [Pedobacter sp. KR3-3]